MNNNTNLKYYFNFHICLSFRWLSLFPNSVRPKIFDVICIKGKALLRVFFLYNFIFFHCLVRKSQNLRSGFFLKRVQKFWLTFYVMPLRIRNCSFDDFYNYLHYQDSYWRVAGLKELMLSRSLKCQGFIRIFTKCWAMLGKQF